VFCGEDAPKSAVPIEAPGQLRLPGVLA